MKNMNVKSMISKTVFLTLSVLMVFAVSAAIKPSIASAAAGYEYGMTLTVGYGNTGAVPAGTGWSVADVMCLVSNTSLQCEQNAVLWKREAAQGRSYIINNCADPGNGYSWKSQQTVVASWGMGYTQTYCLWEKTDGSVLDLKLGHHGVATPIEVNCTNPVGTPGVVKPTPDYTFSSRACAAVGGASGPCVSDICIFSKNVAPATPAVTCSTNTDCGTNAFTGGPFCTGNNVYKNYTTYTCNNPGTASSACTNSSAPQLQTTCAGNQTCGSGTCNTNNFTCNTNADCGTNAFTGGPFCQGNNVYKNYTTYTCNNPGTVNATCTNSTVQQLQTTCASNQTCGSGTCNTTNITCSSNTDCGTNAFTGGPFCTGNNVYRNFTTYTCSNPGTVNSTCSNSTAQQLQTTCAGNQTCSGGSCGGNTTSTCSSNSDCGSNGYTGGPFCQGNNVYQNYRMWTCNFPSTSNSYCSSTTQAQLSTTCAYGQTCGNGTCGTTNTCTQNSYQSCVGNSKYWFDSCGTQGSYIGTCNTVNVCSPHATFRCASNGVYWFDSCGNQQELYQACTGNQTCPSGSTVCVNQNINYGNLTVNVQVRNLSSGNLNWSNSVAANPSDILQFNVTLSANGNTYANNVVVRDTLPSNLYYDNHLTVDGVSNSGSIISGINIGTVSYGQTRTVMYQVQVAPAQNFIFGTTTMYDAVNASTSDTYNNSGTGSASVAVVRSGVLGATTVSTGLTNYFWVDSFFLPLLLALLGLWAYKSGILNSFGLAGWIADKKASRQNIITNKELQEKISKIKEKEII